MRIVSWNINSIRAHSLLVQNFIEEIQPDIILFQETKVDNEVFPAILAESNDYYMVCDGGKQYKGVAIFSKWEISDVQTPKLTGDVDDVYRYIKCNIKNVDIICLYAPNGREYGTEYFAKKIAFFNSILQDLRNHKTNPTIIGGDFNIAYDDRDVHEKWSNKLLCSEEERNILRTMKNEGWVDTFRQKSQNRSYTWWDYRAMSFKKNLGARIDYIFTKDNNKKITIEDAGVYTNFRDMEKPSDHAPIFAKLNII